MLSNGTTYSPATENIRQLDVFRCFLLDNCIITRWIASIFMHVIGYLVDSILIHFNSGFLKALAKMTELKSRGILASLFHVVALESNMG